MVQSPELPDKENAILGKLRSPAVEGATYRTANMQPQLVTYGRLDAAQMSRFLSHGDFGGVVTATWCDPQRVGQILMGMSRSISNIAFFRGSGTRKQMFHDVPSMTL
ncbi:hypothetical protein JTE90_016238 [Oedothorax gibbosus]|uniref:Uncharacterized protein n=1 Tax=Oedothorax gibbosus TaxID=931172 RepID=A0AAV6VSR6_9ARAC|nr:hypothetical protein JTE90_016238 [Oedothorax gibbosus]